MMDPVGLYVVGGCAVLAILMTSVKALMSIPTARRRDRERLELVVEIAHELESLRRDVRLSSEDAASRLARIEQMVETSQLEIERVGEGQRFVAKALASQLPSDKR